MIFALGQCNQTTWNCLKTVIFIKRWYFKQNKKLPIIMIKKTKTKKNNFQKLTDTM